MHVIEDCNVNLTRAKGLWYLSEFGVPTGDGTYIESPQSVTTTIARPNECVYLRPPFGNPFFALYEGLWSLLGRRDLKPLLSFAPSFGKYSDDAKVLQGALGYRWRHHFDFDQLAWIIEELKNDASIIASLTMWDGYIDPPLASAGAKDVPTSTYAQFTTRPSNSIDLTVFNRVEDPLDDRMSLNPMRFSLLQQFVAASIGANLGTLTFVSARFRTLAAPTPAMDLVDPYENIEAPMPIDVETPSTFMQDVTELLTAGPILGLKSQWLRRVAVPVLLAHKYYRDTTGEDKFTGAIEILQQCQSEDWKLACTLWLICRRDSIEESRRAT